MKKQAIIALCILFSHFSFMSAQSSQGGFDRFRREKTEEFNRWRENKKTEFEKYRHKLNEDFARMMEGKWKNYDSSPAEKRKDMPKPVKPLDADHTKITKPQQIPVDIVTQPEREIPDIPVTLPDITPGRQVKYPVSFTFYNTVCGINEFDKSAISFNGTSSGELARAWRKLSDNDGTEVLINDCLRIREELNLCDWGYMKMLETMAAALYPKSADRQAFFTVFMLNQSGYDAKLAMRGNRLCTLFHPSHMIYSEPYFTLGGKNYFVSGPLAGSSAPLTVCDIDFRKDATPIRMVMNRIPAFSPGNEKARVYSSAQWKLAPPIEVKVNPSVIRFMDNYPLLDWQLYGLSKVSVPVKSVLYQALSLIIEGMNEVDAVNTLLNYMQFGFNYMTDGDQFGREKPFFIEENFFYPANDCEDRAILFADIVKSLLGLDVVYLNYPRHLATAVNFPSDLNGTYVLVDGKKYFVCDPTCLNGKAGTLAAVYSGSKPKVIKISEQ